MSEERFARGGYTGTPAPPVLITPGEYVFPGFPESEES